MEKENKKKLILKILLVAVLILIVLYLIFFLGKEDKTNEVPVSLEYEKIQRNMVQLKEFAEKLKEENGFYNNSDEDINIDFCKIDSNFFTGTGDGHFLCSIIVSTFPDGLSIKMNSKNEEVSKYCISKTLETEENYCIDYSGYLGFSSGCESDYKCK